MAKPKSKLKKYNISNITNNEFVGEKLTKKATLEWLESMIELLDDKESLDFAKDIYGENLSELNIHKTMIKRINLIAGAERLPSLMDKELCFNKELFVISLWEEEDK